MFRFLIYPVLGGEALGELQLSDVTFTESVDGLGTTFEGKASITSGQSADKLKQLLNYPGNPGVVALYVKWNETFLWGGPVKTRPWDISNRKLTITAVSWKSWLYSVFLPMDVSTNPVTDVAYSWTDTEQFTIARDIVDYVTDQPGTPYINTSDLGESGIQRDRNLFGSDFIYAGDAIDSFADRYKGFEWDVLIDTNSSGNPVLRLGLFYPKRQFANAGILLKSTESGGNILSQSNPDDSSEEVVTRVWATGSGQPPDQLTAYDSDPQLDDETILLSETKSSYSSVVDISTLADHAKGERQFKSFAIQQITVVVLADSPDFTLYGVGDKIRLILQDDWLDLDLGSVRIVSRTFRLNSSDDRPDLCQLLIDLNDNELPQNEEVG